MKDTEVLKKLYTLQNLKSPESDKFISEWIKDIKIAIAKDSEENIGFGNALKVMEKYIKSNEKKGNGLDGILPTAKRGVFIFSDGIFAVKCRTDFGLPVLKDLTKTGQHLLTELEKDKVACKKKVVLPTRADLDAIIKDWKSQPKERRTQFPEYDFGEGKPKFNAQELMDLLAFFPMQHNGYIWNDGTHSHLFISFTPFEAVIMPLVKKG